MLGSDLCAQEYLGESCSVPPALQLHVSSAAGPSPLPGKERCFCPRSVTGFTVTSPFCNAHGRVFYSDPGSKEGSCPMPCVFCRSCSHFGTGCQLGIPRGSNPALAARLLNCMVFPPPKTTLLLHGVAVSPSTFGTWLSHPLLCVGSDVTAFPSPLINISLGSGFCFAPWVGGH